MSENTQDPITAGILRALDDIHGEFEKASKNLDKEHAGATKTADARVELIRIYSYAVERVVGSYVGTFI